MRREVVIDVAEFNRFWVTVEGRDIEEIKRNAREAVDRGDYDKRELGVGGIDHVEPVIHPIMEEKFFIDPEEKEVAGPLGVAEKFGGSFCMDCNPFKDASLPEDWIYLIEPFNCSNCRKEIK